MRRGRTERDMTQNPKEVAVPSDGSAAIRMPVPSRDQQAYLTELAERTGKYDPALVVGGPRRSRDVAA